MKEKLMLFLGLKKAKGQKSPSPLFLPPPRRPCGGPGREWAIYDNIENYGTQKAQKEVL